MSIEIAPSLRRLVAERAFHVGEYCLVHEEDLYHGCEVDHIQSIKHGGLTVAENLALSCFHCNRHKGTDLESIGSVTGALIRFYDPRRDGWRDHFQWNDDRIEPLSEIGEVTTRVLEFNHPERIAHRKLLAAAGRYPTIEALALLNA